MIRNLLRTGLFISLLLLTCAAAAQISHGGSPIFKNGGAKVHLQSIELPPFTAVAKSQIAEDAKGAVKLKHAQYAYKYKVSYSIQNDGVWENLNDGRRVWRLAISSKDAYSLGLEFSEFQLPDNAQLFVYNNQNDQVLGSYTKENNKASGRFSISPLQGDQVILEYIEPENPEFEAKLKIEAVLHDYKNIFNLLQGKSGQTKAAGSCNVDINCPDGDAWQKEKNSVCHILYDGWIASGALINNTKQDGRALFLTAYHAIHDQAVADIAIFYFKYENSTCGGSDGTRSLSITGANLLATTSKLDFALLELSSTPPASYSPYYAGWDRSGRVPYVSTCIHHPSGDAKKISIDNDSPLTATYSDARYTFDTDTHWQIQAWDVGTTEGGSSGSPLFDENHRIIGDLTGGDANCTYSVNDYFAKISASWENYPASNEQLKYWLDPLNTGVQVLDGLDPYAGLLANFNASSDSICQSTSITFTDQSTGSPDTFTWYFGNGADVATTTGQGPFEISYSTAGKKEISLVVTKNGVKDSITKEIMVYDFPVADFDYQLELQTVSVLNTSVDASNYEWAFGDGSISTEQNPSHSYAASGDYTITLTASNICGSINETKSVSISYNKQLKVYPNPSDGKFTIDLSKIAYSKLIWAVYATRGGMVRNGEISQNTNPLEFDLSGLAAGIYILRMNIDGIVVKRKLVLTH